MYDFKKIKTKDRTLQNYKHKEFSKSKSEEEINLIKKQDKNKEKPIQKNNNMFDKIIGREASEEEVNFLEKIEKLDEESKLKEYINILKEGRLSYASNEKILKYLLEKSNKDNDETKNYIEKEFKNVIIQNYYLMEEIEKYNNVSILQKENIKKKNILIAYLILLLLNKIIEDNKNLGENEKKKKLQKHLFYKLKNIEKIKI